MSGDWVRVCKYEISKNLGRNIPKLGLARTFCKDCIVLLMKEITGRPSQLFLYKQTDVIFPS